MPRTARASVGGMCYHVLNRGNARQEVFHKSDDYAAFLKLLIEASERLPMQLLGYCLMPNHFHLVLRPPALSTVWGKLGSDLECMPLVENDNGMLNSLRLGSIEL